VRQLDIDVNRWATEIPTVDACRPGQCPCCGIASRPIGDNLKIHGHGLVSRQFRGPRGPNEGDAPEITEILLRRFLCVPCGAVISVGPRGMLERKLYRGSAIAFALALWTLELLTIGAVRQRVSPWARQGWSVKGRWASLKRWASEAMRGGLWRIVRRNAVDKIDRSAIAQELIRLAAFGGPSKLGALSASDIFYGAAQYRGGPSVG
jgi:hypothetical protein